MTVEASDGAAGPQVRAPEILKLELLRLFRDWILATRPGYEGAADEVAWFISKRATALINMWLNNRGMAVLHTNRLELGAVVIARERVQHILSGRTLKDRLTPSCVEELMAALFVHGSPKYAPHSDARKYPNQLLMFDPSYKSMDAAASGESPVAALQWIGHPEPHLRLLTAYWAPPAKTKALDGRALKR
jgi:hypothetical protein